MQNHIALPSDTVVRFDVREWRNGLAVLSSARARIVVDDTTFDAPTHKVDCYKNRAMLSVFEIGEL